ADALFPTAGSRGHPASQQFHCWPTGARSMESRPPIFAKASSARRPRPTRPSWCVSSRRSPRSRLRREPDLVIVGRVDVAEGAQLWVDGPQLLRRHVSDVAGGEQGLDTTLAGGE